MFANDKFREEQPEYGQWPKWITSCCSSSTEQLVIGFGTSINKSTDFAQLQVKWEELIASAPKEVQELVKDYEADVHYMSGHI